MSISLSIRSVYMERELKKSPWDRLLEWWRGFVGAAALLTLTGCSGQVDPQCADYSSYVHRCEAGTHYEKWYNQCVCDKSEW